jgi:Amidase
LELLVDITTLQYIDSLPLYGVLFAVKDNIDMAGMPTTAGCPAFAYTASTFSPSRDAAGSGWRHPGRQDEHGPICHWAGGDTLALWRCA